MLIGLSRNLVLLWFGLAALFGDMALARDAASEGSPALSAGAYARLGHELSGAAAAAPAGRAAAANKCFNRQWPDIENKSADLLALAKHQETRAQDMLAAVDAFQSRVRSDFEEIVKTEGIVRADLREVGLLVATTGQEAGCSLEAARLLRVQLETRQKMVAAVDAAIAHDLSTLSARARNEVLDLARKANPTAVSQLAQQANSTLQSVLLTKLDGVALKEAKGQILKSLRNAAENGIPPLEAAARKKAFDEVNEKDLLRNVGKFVNGLWQMRDKVAEAQQQATALRDGVLGYAKVAEDLAKDVRDNPTKYQAAEKRAAVAAVLMLAERFQRGQPVPGPAIEAALKVAGVPKGADLDTYLKAAGVPTRGEWKQTFNKLSDFRNPGGMAEGVAAIQGYVAVAQSLGVDVSPKFSNALAKGTTILTTVGSFYSGNFIGAFKGASSMFGGKGKSERMSSDQFDAVMGSLRDIQKMQREALEKLDNLSAQLADATAQTLGRLDAMNETLVHTLNFLNDQLVETQRTDCKAFLKSAADKYWYENGAFRTYNDRVGHFESNSKSTNDRVTPCRDLLDRVLKVLGNGNIYAGLLDTLSGEELRKGPAGPDRSLWKRRNQYYDPMLSLTTLSLGAESPAEVKNAPLAPRSLDNPCSRRLMWALALVPTSLNQVEPSRLGCANPADSFDLRLKYVGVAVSGDTPHADVALQTPLNAPLVAELGEYLLFMNTFGPYQKEGESTLIAEDKVRQGKLGDTKRYHERMRDALDVVNIALLQQTMLSGVYILPALSEIIIRHDFGKKVPKPPTAQPAKAAKDPAKPASEAQAPSTAGPCDVRSKYHSQPYDIVVCMLAYHPELAQNLMVYLVRLDVGEDDARKGGYTPSQLRERLRDGEVLELSGEDGKPYEDRSALRRLLPTLHASMVPLDKLWHLELRSEALPTGQLLLPMPPTQAVVDGTVSYPEVTNSLLDVRQSLLAELAELPSPATQAALWASFATTTAPAPAPQLTYDAHRGRQLNTQRRSTNQLK